MKLPITDQFLLDIIRPLVGIGGEIMNYLLSTKYQQIHILFGNDNPIFRQYRKEKRYKQFNQLVYHLKRRNFIKVKNLKGKKAIMLTKGGFNKLLKASFKIQEKKKRKDRRWIMIAFDIPQHNRKARNLLRSVLKNLGYKLFQQSVWVTPYDVIEKTEKLLQVYSLDKYVKIFLIEKL